jgi:hypothetical protein
MGYNIMSPTLAFYPSRFSKGIKTQDPSAPIKSLAPLWRSTAGTGGVITARSLLECNCWQYNLLNRPISIEPSTNKNIDTRSPAEHTANIRDVFAVNMSDLAVLLGVTRPTAYAWLEGNEPKPEAITRIQRLSRIADRVKRMNIERMDKLIHRKILNGESLFDLLKTDKDPFILLQSLKEISEKEARTRREPKSSGKHLRSLDEIVGESGVPIDRRS